MALVAAATLIGGCGRGGDERTASLPAPTPTTKVEVVRALDDGKRASGKRDGFDPARIYERDAAGVVTVVATGLRTGDGSTPRPGPGGSGLGSGFVISGNGEIATNAHVVTSGEGAEINQAGDVYVRFADGNKVEAEVVGFDPFADVALLKVDPTGLTLRPLPLGSASDLSVGAPVAAIGSPFGEEQSLSVGVISALDRSIESLTGFATTGAIQTDAAINHGNSGGPLLDAGGRVLGINSQIRTSSGDGTGVGFAVPVDAVRRSLAQLRRDGRARYAYLGVATTALFPQLAQRFSLPAREGAWVQEVTAGGPSAAAGLRAGRGEERFQERSYAVGGDVITAVAGRRIVAESDLARAVARFAPGDEVTLEIIRDGDRRSVRVTLGERPLGSPR